jgi:hypothetical protein
MTLLVLVPSSTSAAAAQSVQQTLVFDLVGRATSFVDKAPSGPSPGDTENITAQIRDAAGRSVGTARTTCVFTKVIPDDVLEDCSASGKTTDGTLKLAGVGHLKSLNPPWPLISGTGAYKGAQGKLVFEDDIPVDPNVPLAAGRLFSVVVFELSGKHGFHAGVVERPAANAAFIHRANAVCSASEAKSANLPQFPFPTFDPFHPDQGLLPQVGRYFDHGPRRRLPQQLLTQLERLGQPPRGGAAWQNVLDARRSVLKAEASQIKAALAGDASTFVHTVYEQASVYNRLVFTSAVFGVQSCTFG